MTGASKLVGRVAAKSTAKVTPEEESESTSESEEAELQTIDDNHPEIRDATGEKAWQCIRCQYLNVVDDIICTNDRCGAARPQQSDRRLFVPMPPKFKLASRQVEPSFVRAPPRPP